MFFSFVLHFICLKWSHICDDIRAPLGGGTHWALRSSVDSDPYGLISFFFFTCIVAQSLPLFSPPVQPGAEAHENNPAGPSQTSDEGWLLHHIWDAIVALRSGHYVLQFCTWRQRTHRMDVNKTCDCKLHYNQKGEVWRPNVKCCVILGIKSTFSVKVLTFQEGTRTRKSNVFSAVQSTNKNPNSFF